MQTGVLLLHGIAGMPAEFRYLSNILQREGYIVSTPIIPGLGCGTDIVHLATWQDWLSAVKASFEELEATCDRVVVGGLSAGAVLALKLAQIDSSRISGLILLAPTLKVNGWSIPWTFKLFTLCQDRFVARMFNFGERDPFGIKDERIRKMAFDAMRAEAGVGSQQFFRVNGMLFLQLRRLVRAMRKSLSSITLPTLIIHPREDDQSGIGNAFYLQRKLAGPTEVMILDDSYHVVTLDKQRQIVADKVKWFLANLNLDTRQVPSVPATLATTKRASPAVVHP